MKSNVLIRSNISIMFIFLILFISVLLLIHTDAIDPIGTNPQGVKHYVDIPFNPMTQFTSLNTTVNMGFPWSYYKDLDIVNEPRPLAYQLSTHNSVNLFIQAHPQMPVAAYHEHVPFSRFYDRAEEPSITPSYVHCVGYTHNSTPEDIETPTLLGTAHALKRRAYHGSIGSDSYPYFGNSNGGAYLAHEWTSHENYSSFNFARSCPPIRSECRLTSKYQVPIIARISWDKSVEYVQTEGASWNLDGIPVFSDLPTTAYISDSPTFQSVSYLYSNHPLTGRTTTPIQMLSFQYAAYPGNGVGMLKFNMTMLDPIDLDNTGFVIMGIFHVDSVTIASYTDINGIKHTTNVPTVKLISPNSPRVDEHGQKYMPPAQTQPIIAPTPSLPESLVETKITVDALVGRPAVSSLEFQIDFRKPDANRWDYRLTTGFRIVMVQRKHVEAGVNTPQITWRSATPLTSIQSLPTWQSNNLAISHNLNANLPSISHTSQVFIPQIEQLPPGIEHTQVRFTRVPSYWTRTLLHLYNVGPSRSQDESNLDWFSPAITLPTGTGNADRLLTFNSLYSPLIAYIPQHELEKDLFGCVRDSLGRIYRPAEPMQVIQAYQNAIKNTYPLRATIHPVAIGPRSVESNGIPANTEVFDVKFNYIGYVPQNTKMYFRFGPGAIPQTEQTLTKNIRSYVDIESFQDVHSKSRGPEPFLIKQTVDTPIEKAHRGREHFTHPTFGTHLSYYYEVPLALQENAKLGGYLPTYIPTYGAAFSFKLHRPTNKGYTLPVNAYGIFDDEIYHVNTGQTKLDLNSWTVLEATVIEQDFTPVIPVYQAPNQFHIPKYHYTDSLSRLMHPYLSPTSIMVDVESIIPPTIPVVARNAVGSVYTTHNKRITGNKILLAPLRTTLPTTSNSFNSNTLTEIVLKPSMGIVDGLVDSPTGLNTIILTIQQSSQSTWSFVTTDTKQPSLNLNPSPIPTDSTLKIATSRTIHINKTQPLVLWEATLQHSQTAPALPHGFNYIPINGSVDSGADVSPFTFTSSLVVYNPKLTITAQTTDPTKPTIPTNNQYASGTATPVIEVDQGTVFVLELEEHNPNRSKNIKIELIDSITKQGLIDPVTSWIGTATSNPAPYTLSVPIAVVTDNAMFQFTFTDKNDVSVVVQSIPFKINQLPDPCVLCVQQNTNTCSSDIGKCNCKPDYEGDTCSDRKKCLQCNADGVESCDTSSTEGTCVCKPQYEGDTCSDRKKCSQCTGAGFESCDTGTTQGKCVCNADYTGDICDTLKCSQCSNNTGFDSCDKSSVDGTCVCKEGYAGTKCEILQCSQCSSIGFESCDTTSTPQGKCVCKADYEGTTCSTLKPCLHCTGEGYDTCDRTITGGKCVCKEGWIGDKCDSKLDFCKHCVVENLDECEAPVTTPDEPESTTGICICNPGWIGDKCDTPDDMSPCQYCNQTNLEQCLPATDKEPNGVCGCKSTHTGRECQDELYVEEEPTVDEEPTEPLSSIYHSVALSFVFIIVAIIGF